MPRPTFAALSALALLAPLPAAAQVAPLHVHIQDPHAGVVQGPVVSLEATISDPSIRHATLVVNGAAYDVSVEQGRVAQSIIAVPGNNRVALLVRDGRRVARDSMTFRYEGDPIELIVLLTWPSEGEIVDLWVREPEGETVKWDHRRSESGGRLLDFSSDAIGFGSQAYALSRARAGAFRVKLHYWGAFAEEDARSDYTYEEMLRALDRAEARAARASTAAEQAEASRRVQRVRRRLDRWASPGAPQTPVRAEVVLFPGTAHERRWRFAQTVTRPGELVTLGQIEISDEMIRAARQEAHQ